MGLICRRCDRITKQKLYHVTTEDAGVVLLNMLVCSSCARQAMKLGLPIVKMESAKSAERIKRKSGMTDLNQRPIQP
jgi:superfamily II helicase